MMSETSIAGLSEKLGLGWVGVPSRQSAAP